MDRPLVLTGEVSEVMVGQVADYLAGRTGRALIYHSTHGGCFYSALGIYDLLKLHREVTMYLVGPVFSSGTIIALGADQRVGLPNTHFLVHYGSSVIESPAEQKQERKAEGIYRQIMLDNLKVSKRRISGWLKEETYIDAKVGLEVGLLHRVEGGQDVKG
jgi:ATP-dependent protease ClpP protease subunit